MEEHYLVKERELE
jgi:hypothetical protein